MKLPKKYGTGKKRLRELAKQRDLYRSGDPRAFKELPTDRAARKAGKVRRSAYTEVADDRDLLFEGDFEELARRALRYYGAKGDAKAIGRALKKSYDKGLAAWASGGHRPGASQRAWGNARLASLLVGGKTYWTSDAKQARTFPAKMRREIEAQIDDVLEALDNQGRQKDADAIEERLT